ncbi:MAG: primary-amine oxidase [Verrucomicrobia bacterium]|nr:primary-amine oxidase [Verrucomicrobiota bacterium]
MLKSLAAALVVGMWLMAWGSQVLATESVRHPMDPLTTQEYSSVITVLREGNYVDEAGLYPLITLHEPSKAEVWRWIPGEALPRQAFVIVKKGPQTFEAVVDITCRKVVSWKEVKGFEPGILLSEEWLFAQRIVRANQKWQEAIRKRGITDFLDVVCIPHTVGYYGTAEEEGRRLVKVVCFESSGTKNFWGRPIEGLIAVVDYHKGEVVRVIDNGIVPIPKSPVDFDEHSVGKLREPPNPISISQLQGPSFKVEGHIVSWQKWQFHFRLDPRLGLIVSMVHYNDHGKLRSVLYQGSLSELFVPYMDPDVGWYFKTYMDAGEYGVGKLAAQLEPGLDCPPNTVFFDAIFADDWGDPYTQERAACLFERYTGDIAWRHYEAVNGQSEVRRSTELVLRSISAIGNYDYIFDWVFRQDGTIKVAIGATGVEQVKAVNSRMIADDKDGHDIAFGHMVAEHTVAVNHDHFFCFRLDLDVDGQQNSFLNERLKTKRLGNESPRKSVWVVDSRTAATEEAAKLRISLEKPALWRVINPNVLGPLGYPVSYQLKPKANAVSLLSPDDFPQQRAGFTDFHLWVTPYNPQERYVAGTYPNQSKGGDGLPHWTSANRPIVNTDIVLWYTLGFHHVVRAEDWPVLPTTWNEFELRPFDFFELNPALDLPK